MFSRVSQPLPHPPMALFRQFLKVYGLASGCGSVGRAVTSDSRGPKFESSQYFQHAFSVNC